MAPQEAHEGGRSHGRAGGRGCACGASSGVERVDSRAREERELRRVPRCEERSVASCAMLERALNWLRLERSHTRAGEGHE